MTARRSVVIEPALTRDRATALLSVVVIAALAWVYLARTGDAPMGTAGGATDLVLLFAMWAAMMTAMMAPSAAPLVLMFATINRRQREARQPYVATSVLLLGYIAVWTGFAALASGMQWTLHEFGALSSWMDGVAPIAGGTVLIVAGVFQWTPLKHACLRHCRTPFGHLMTRWRPGPRGAFVLGLRHGGVCVGCCWALMSLMFVGGSMSFLWMVGIAAYIAVEKMLPDGHGVARLAGLGLVAWGLWTLAQSL